MIFFFLFLWWIACGLVAMSVANAKHCNGGLWLLGGLLMGPIAVIAAAGLPDRKLRRTMRLIAEAQGVDLDEQHQYPNTPPANTAPLSDEEIEEQRRRVLGE